MHFENLTPSDYPAFLNLYNGSFPADERRLYADVSDFEFFIREKSGEFRVFAAKDGDCFLGFLSFWLFKGFIYVEHFAVIPEFRGNGIGEKMLNHLFSAVGENVLLEVELPDTDEAHRRIGFYERNGFRIRDEIEYIQPPYSAGQSGMPLLLMTHGEVNLQNPDSLREMLSEVYGVNA